MRFVKWGIAALGLLLVSGVVAFSVVSFTGTAQAQGPGGETARTRYQELLAQKLGISVAQLETAQKAARDQMIEEGLAAGKITTAQAAELKALQPGEFRRGVLGRVRDGAKHVMSNILDAAATVIGIDREQIKTGLQSGQSLSQIAAAKGVSRDQLEAGLMRELRSDIQDALAKGTISQVQADKLLNGLEQRIDQIIDRTGGQGMRSSTPGGPKPGLR